MQLKDLVGKRLLSGIESVQVEVEGSWHSGPANGIRFILDGITYQATEDESDGYRSYLNELEVVTEPVRNTFPPQEVLVTYSEEWDDDVIILTDTTTAKQVLRLGTENTSDYYPYCVMEWSPENMAVNVGK